jgi:uncharacterized membrane protein YeaQ/YmgE (transglycosylase-associated protein family)
MGFLAFLILGLAAGAIAKLILPGKQGGGWLITLLLGVVGALLGGFLGSVLFGTGLEEFFSLQKPVQTRGDMCAHQFAGIAGREVRAVEQHDRRDMAERRIRFHVEERCVKTGKLQHVTLSRSLSASSGATP